MPELSSSQYGTEVHYRMKQEIDSLGRSDVGSEYSVSDGREAGYGDKGSTRFDIYQYDDAERRVCVYDVFTGQGEKRASDLLKQYEAMKSFIANDKGWSVYDLLVLQIDARRR